MTIKLRIIIRIFILAIVVSTIANGSITWLKSVGWINPDMYDQLISQQASFSNMAKQYRLNPSSLSEEKITTVVNKHKKYAQKRQDFLYKTEADYFFIKALKYLSIFMWFCLCVCYMKMHKNRPVVNLSTLLFTTLIIYQTITSTYRFGWPIVIAASYLYFFIFLSVLAMGLFSNKQVKSLAGGFAYTLILILVMIPVELQSGIHYFSTNSIFNTRLTSFMVLPNTLGVYTICIYTLWLSQYKNSQPRLIMISMTLASLFIIVLSGSNTALLSLFMLFLYYTFSNKLSKQHKARYASVTVFIGICLYFIQGRVSINSIYGRVAKYMDYFTMDISWLELVLGQGAAISSNTLIQIHQHLNLNSLTDKLIYFSADSTALLLIIQLGIVGCFLFYLILIKAMLKDPQLRPVYLVFILSSLTINMLEVFPLNIILGLMLAKTFNQFNSGTSNKHAFKQKSQSAST